MISSIVSIIIPVYNAEKYLNSCIDSVLNQTYSNFELILINDGSNDSSGDICDKYVEQDARIHVFHKENGGVSSARNLGISKASGEYIVFVDSDDRIKSDMIENLLVAVDQSACDLVVQGMEDSLGRSYKIEQESTFSYDDLESAFETLISNLLLNSPCNKLYRRSIVQSLKFDTSMYMGEDLVFNLNYIRSMQQDIKLIPYCGYLYNLENENSSIHRWTPTLFEQRKRLFLELRKFADEKKFSSECMGKIKYSLFIETKGSLLSLYNSSNSRSFKREMALSYLNDELVRQNCIGLKLHGAKDKLSYLLIRLKAERIMALMIWSKNKALLK